MRVLHRNQWASSLQVLFGLLLPNRDKSLVKTEEETNLIRISEAGIKTLIKWWLNIWSILCNKSITTKEMFHMFIFHVSKWELKRYWKAWAMEANGPQGSHSHLLKNNPTPDISSYITRRLDQRLWQCMMQWLKTKSSLHDPMTLNPDGEGRVLIIMVVVVVAVAAGGELLIYL